MATLKELLKDTVTFTGDPNAKSLGKTGAVPAMTPYEKDNPQLSSVWKWKFSNNSPNEISNLTCASHGMNMVVCEKIKWEMITINVKGQTHFLKLEKEFLLDKFYSAEGEIKKKQSDLWVLPALTDPTMAIVFGFQFKNNKFYPIDPKSTLDENFIPKKGEKPQPFKPQQLNKDKLNTIKVQPLRIIVVVEISTKKQKDDFEPSGLVYAARFSPHMMLVSNYEIKWFKAEITLIRPAKTMQGMAEDMNSEVGTILITETNTPITPIPPQYPISGKLLPYWDNLFDGHNFEPMLNNEYVVVDPKGKHVPKDTKVINYPISNPPKYSNRQVGALTGQGVYDNIHMAPTMKAPKEIIKLRPEWKNELSKIIMAPVCFHDCLHMHWRWGWWLGAGWLALEDAAPFWGFNAEGKPNSVQGAPQVPPNQEIRIRVNNKHAFTYVAFAESDIKIGMWQIVMHHGGSYIVQFNPNKIKELEEVKKICTDETKDFGEGNKSWAMFYFNLRYGTVGATRKRIAERLKNT